MRGAGTDANVTIILFGSNGMDTGKVKLDTSKNNFERAQMDIFQFEFPDLGDIPEVEIEHDNSGMGPGWHCEQVVVNDDTTNKSYIFTCDRWLATDEDDGLIRRRLKGSVGSGITNYRVTVYTSDCRGAGTDANVYCELSGMLDGKEVWGPRHKLDSKNNFERNETDNFLLKKQRALGQLSKVKVGHDNSGVGPGWHLDHVEVTDDQDGKMYYFPCNRWFDKYKISVHTSDIRFSGTDANVYIQLFGQLEGVEKTTEKAALNSSKNDFERGNIDVFNLTLTNVGDLKRIIIGHDNFGAGASWHLNMVEIFCVNSGQTERFVYNGWLAKDEEPYKLEVELFPEGGDKPPIVRYTVTVYTSDIRGAGTDANVTMIMYTVTVYTSDIRGAGTDANVTMIMYGDNGLNSPSLKLDNSKNNFERDMMDEFICETIDLGKLTKIQLSHDDSGLGPGWHVDHVEILHQTSGERFYFLADQWMEKKLGTLSIMLECSNAAGAKQTFKVSIQTGDKRGAGTDSDISIILFGDNGKTKELKLESSKDNFERNKVGVIFVY
eukprot:gene18434-24910_t